MKTDAILTPAELPTLARRDLRQTVCVVFDVLRATSTVVTALQHGAKEVIPVSEISEALALKKSQPDVLLAGERDGLRIRAAQTGGTDFDLGNSPREFTPQKIRGRTIVSSTTNGTRALRACAGAKTVLAASFLNLRATAQFLRTRRANEWLLVCAGTRENVALEDVLAAGALCEISDGELTDAAQIALAAWRQAQTDLAVAVSRSENARRLLALPELRDDVAFCLQRDAFPLVAQMKNGALRRWTPPVKSASRRRQ
jgi:2-phosphosulfolactate phosphatase